MRPQLIFGIFSFCVQVFAAEKYVVNIKPDFANQSIRASTEIFINDSTAELKFPVYLDIDSVTSKKKPVLFKVANGELTITNPKSPLLIKYHGKPAKGLVWGKDFVYTNYDPCTWMICSEEPGQRVAIEIHVKAPKKMKSVDTSDHRGYASYLYGFAVGKFTSVTENNLQFLGIDQTAEQLKQKFKITKDVVDFFERKSGVPLPLKKYTQVLVPGSEAQEKNGFSILGTDEIDPILKDPKEDWAIVHELAHQWWGNLLTCKSWEHFWLNEGLTVFMTAAYKQQKWGEAEYKREMQLAQKHWQRAIDGKFDKPLSFAGEYPSLGVRRSIQYSKAALFLDALRKQMSDDIFWTGIKDYTSTHQLQSVESKDFQASMEKVYGKSLQEIFNKWVY